MEVLEKYLKTENPNADMIRFISNLDAVASVDPELAGSVVAELHSQRHNLKLIASENYSSLAVQGAMGNLFTDKYSEGFPYHRFYAGCDNVDFVEQRACDKACKLFGAEHAYVQPHSGADANLCAYWAILDHKVKTPALEEIGCKNPSSLSTEDWNRIRELCHNQKLLGLDYYSGGHLTHGYRMNVSAQMFECHSYGVGDDGYLDYDAIEKQAMEIKPLILLAGYSAYPRKVNFKRMKEIADKCGAVLMVDMAHFAGLVAGKVFTDEYSPFPWADVVTTTTHKTLRGPRGGMVLCKEEFAESVDKGCPLVIGGPLPQMMLAKAVALEEASQESFKDYARHIVDNAQALAESLMKRGFKVATGGTDNHLLLLDTSYIPAMDGNPEKSFTGKQAEFVLRKCGITCNRNALPKDPNGPWYTSGIRLGTPAVTTLGMGTADMETIGDLIAKILSNADALMTKKGVPSRNKAVVRDVAKEAEILEQVENLLDQHKVYPSLDLDYLMKAYMDCNAVEAY